VIGTPTYMAPEQARGGQIDRRADLFAVGTVLWEVLADKRLFKGEGEADTLNRVLFEPIPRLRDIAPSVPPVLEAVTMRSLERDPEKRQITAQAFAEELEKAARSVHAIATVREVAEYVTKVLGQDIAQQREAVRAWLAQSEPSRTDLDDHDIIVSLPPGSSSVSSAAISIPPHHGVALPSPDLLSEITRARRKRKRTLWTTGVAMAAIAGAAALYSAKRDAAAVSASSTPPLGPAALFTHAATQPAATPATTVAPPPAPVATPAPSAAAPEAATKPAVGKQVPVQPPVMMQRRPKAAPAAAPAAPAAAPAPAAGDDIPRNPYR